MIRLSLQLLTATCLASLAVAGRAADADKIQNRSPSSTRDSAIASGVEYLLQSQDNDGAFSARLGPGVSMLAIEALLKNGRGVDDPKIAKGLKYIESFVQKDGSVTSPKTGIANYETSLAISCFSRANKDGRYSKTIDNATKYLKGVQLDERKNRTPASADYGGMGYSSKSPGADLSNTHMMLDALKDAGNPPDDEAVKRALIFVSHCQNLESQHNPLPFSAKVNDGGFYYSPNGDGYSAAGKGAQGALRSYGSMTYAGLKSMVYAGVSRDDVRVKAAVKWLQSNYSVSENPGLGQEGVYYYYHLMAKCLDALGAPTFEDAAGRKHNWRAELAAALAKRQRANGSWVNENNRWYEGDPNLATSFALLSLAYCQGDH
jgi:squalene-hopene/tetraprenyl-beta-curcumene cyclase